MSGFLKNISIDKALNSFIEKMTGDHIAAAIFVFFGVFCFKSAKNAKNQLFVFLFTSALVMYCITDYPGVQLASCLALFGIGGHLIYREFLKPAAHKRRASDKKRHENVKKMATKPMKKKKN